MAGPTAENRHPKCDARRGAQRRQRGQDLLRDGWRDADVARWLGVSREAVRLWRVELGLPRRPPMAVPPTNPFAVPSQVRWEAEQLLRTRRFLDHQIAKRVGFTTATIAVWRRELGLPPLTPARPGPSPHQVRCKAVLLLRTRRFLDYQIAKRVGVTAATIGLWRKELGLPPLTC